MVWSIQSDLRGNARIWSNNLQIVCVQLPTSLQIRVQDGHHGRHGHHGRDGRDGHHGRHGPHGHKGHQDTQDNQDNQDTRDRQDRQAERTDMTFKLDFPGNLCREAFAILAMFLFFCSISDHFHHFDAVPHICLR